VGVPDANVVRQRVSAIVGAMPRNCRTAIIAMDNYVKDPDSEAIPCQTATSVNCALRDVCRIHGVELFYIAEYVDRERDRDFTGHFQRQVYFRAASEIIRWALHGLPASRSASSVS
jgi:hypothetical protein